MNCKAPYSRVVAFLAIAMLVLGPGLFGEGASYRTANTSWVSNYVNSSVSETNTVFSNSVMNVGVNVDSGTVTNINEMVSGQGGTPLPTGGAAVTVGCLLLAIATSVVWLKKKVIYVNDNLPYSLVALSGVQLVDRSINYVSTSSSLSDLLEPDRKTRKDEQGADVPLLRDFLIDITNTGSADITIDFKHYTDDPQTLNFIGGNVADLLKVTAGHRAWIYFSEAALTDGVATLTVFQKDLGAV